MARIIVKQNQMGAVQWSVLSDTGASLVTSAEFPTRAEAYVSIEQFTQQWPEAQLNIIDQTPEARMNKAKANDR